MLDKFDDEDLKDLDETKIDETPNEDNLESAMKPHDYSARRILVWEADDERRNNAVEILSGLLTGAFVQGVATEKDALARLDSEPWDTFVVDFYNEGLSASEFIKRVNNYPNSILVALNLAPFTLPEERNRYKLEPLRKLFDIEKPKSEDDEEVKPGEDEDSEEDLPEE